VKISKEEATRRLYRNEFPKSNKYDSEFILNNQMGPNVLWLVEWLCRKLDLKEGMKVLDLGCGKAMSSIFLAREFNVQVWAYDLWIAASDNWDRICSHALQDSVFPIHGRATELPFADNFFDVIVAFDSYHYFGTDDLYLNYVSRFLKPGGQLGIVVPGFMREVGMDIPAHLTEVQSHGGVFWCEDCWTFHTKEWWFRHWQRSQLIEVRDHMNLPHGWRLWRDWEKIITDSGVNIFHSEEEVLTTDQGEYLGFIGMTANKNSGTKAAISPSQRLSNNLT